VGRYHETRSEWPQAAAAYAKAADFLKAGECFSKAADMARAGECFERCKEFYRSGVSYARAARYKDAIRVLQQLTDKSPNFDESRGLLGRCFYELHDYEHCAAALDNHLTGARVDSGNMEYFYMLALAYEQLGKLDKSRELLYKIRSVNTGFRDVTQRISNISSRISMEGGATQVTPYSGGGSGAGTPMMENVENSLEGRYELEKELGRGGMGVVYMARDKQLDRKVALKFLGTLIDNSDEYRERFVREARTAAKISHPNVINIFDISASVGKAYIAMEFVDGPSLHRYISSKGAFDVRRAINIMQQTASALAAIHEAGIVHRDIKPDNILIAKGGLVKVMDFGLAKAEDHRMTRTGVVMGTPSYMAPEQVLGKEADARSDIYSLGLVFYECLSGETVFRTGDILERQLKEMPPPPSQVVKDLPPEVDAVIMRCIAKERDERYQTMHELAEALRGLNV
jgi:eukaryotic-like serine/threonine-protein kinase